MTTTQHPSSAPPRAAVDAHATDPTANLNAPTRRVLAVLRIAFGFTFLWAFFDKLLALGFSTGVGEDGTTDRFGPPPGSTAAARPRAS